jgi:DNA-directed RNA polymerase alpha subunit
MKAHDEIDCLPLEIEAGRALQRGGVRTIDDLLSLSLRSLVSIPGIGPGRAAHIVAVVALPFAKKRRVA